MHIRTRWSTAVLAAGVFSLSACTTNPSTSDSISLPFQSFGNEPGWSVKIDTQQRAEILLDYGDRTFSIDLPTPQKTYAGTHYRTTYQQQPFALDIIYKTCLDTMSDEVFDYEVLFRIEGKSYRGCGRQL